MAESTDQLSDWVSRAQSLPDAIENTLSGFGGILRCETCGRTVPVGDAGRRVTTTGWPVCHRYTMTWWTQRQIDAGEMPGLP